MLKHLRKVVNAASRVGELGVRAELIDFGEYPTGLAY
jgi:hypothetical protein